MSRGPVSDAILVNLLLDGMLSEKLKQWREASITARAPHGSNRGVVEFLNAELRERAARVNAPPRVFHEAAVQRWIDEGW